MTDGMKSGSGGDPFAEESDDESTEEVTDSAEQEEDEVTETDSNSGEQDPSTDSHSSATDTSTQSDQNGLPYIFARSNAKTDRTMVQYFLREETQDIEDEAEHAIKQELGTDVLLTDVREALVLVGANHIDEVADELRDWGYRFKED